MSLIQLISNVIITLMKIINKLILADMNILDVLETAYNYMSKYIVLMYNFSK